MTTLLEDVLFDLPDRGTETITVDADARPRPAQGDRGRRRPAEVHSVSVFEDITAREAARPLEREVDRRTRPMCCRRGWRRWTSRLRSRSSSGCAAPSIADDCGYAHPVALAEAFVGFAKSRFKWTVDPARVRSAPEVMVAVAEILRVVTQPGDGVVINPPVYPPFAMVIEEVRPRDRRGAALARRRAADGISISSRSRRRSLTGAKAYLLCNPHNPVGRVYEKAQLESIAKLAKQYGVVVLSDEIHAPLVLPGAVHVPFVSDEREDRRRRDHDHLGEQGVQHCGAQVRPVRRRLAARC